MTLLFDPLESVVLFLAVLTVNYTVQDGKSNWLEGMILMCKPSCLDCFVVIPLTHFQHQVSTLLLRWSSGTILVLTRRLPLRSAPHAMVPPKTSQKHHTHTHTSVSFILSSLCYRTYKSVSIPHYAPFNRCGVSNEILLSSSGSRNTSFCFSIYLQLILAHIEEEKG